jgi:hypothetical protein
MFIFIGFFTFCLTSSNAQNYDPIIKEGSFWDFEFWYYPGGGTTPFCPEKTSKFQIAQDTLINGKVYKKIKAHQLQGEPSTYFPEFCLDAPLYYNSNQFIYENRFIREDLDEKVVYIWAETRDDLGNLVPFKEMILYDFDVQVGDVIPNVYIGDSYGSNEDVAEGIEVTQIVTEVGYDDFLQKNFVRTDYGIYYEGLGSYDGLFRELQISLAHIQNLVCNGDAQNQNNCTAILSIEDEKFQTLKIYPNPTDDIININYSEPLSFKIFNLQGRFIKSFSSNVYSKLDVSTLQGGVYILEVQDNLKHKKRVKIIKK